MDIHHIINKFFANHFIVEYDATTATSIVLPSREHYLLSKYRGKHFEVLQSLMEDELESISRYTDVPDTVIQTLKTKIKEYTHK